jgi:hypothetical protein
MTHSNGEVIGVRKIREKCICNTWEQLNRLYNLDYICRNVEQNFWVKKMEENVNQGTERECRVLILVMDLRKNMKHQFKLRNGVSHC